MRPISSRLDGTETALVLDASVLINLLGTGCTAEIFQALGSRVIVEETVRREVRRNPRDGSPAHVVLDPLFAEGALSLERMSADALNVFIDLVGADPRYGLGDGEAATIALADSLRAAAVLDDRKAGRVAGERFAHLTVCSTLDLLSCPRVVDALGMTRLAEAVFDALRYARMRVPHRFDGWLRELIGPERAAQCPSLKRR